MMAIDMKRLNEADQVLGEASIERATKARAEHDMQARFLAIACGAAGWEAGSESHPRGWFVIRTKNRAEKAVENTLTAAGIECWFAVKTTDVLVYGSRRRRNVVRPIWLGYLFVKVVPCNETWAGLLRVDGVASVIGTASGPARIDDEIMNDLMGLVNKGVFNERHDAKPFKVGARVMIKAGHFEGFKGAVQGYVGKRAVRVLAEVFGGHSVIELGVAQLEESA